MNIRLNLIRIYIPNFFKKRKLQELFQLTAQAFQYDVPDTKNLSYQDCLQKYAQFTSAAVDTAIKRNADLGIIKIRLFQNAFKLGQKFRKDLRIKKHTEIMSISKLIYRLIGIEFHGDISGEVEIKHCFFSHFYTSQVCQIICALDEGLFAGLSSGGKLVFEERITEGKNCCRAIFSIPEHTP